MHKILRTCLRIFNRSGTYQSPEPLGYPLKKKERKRLKISFLLDQMAYSMLAHLNGKER